MVGNFVDEYQPFDEMNRDALRFALESHGVDLPFETIDEILSTYHDLDPFEDVRGGLEELAEAGHHVSVLSNGDPEMLESMAHVAGSTFDVRGAMHAGMQGVWINRDDGPWDPSATEPDLIVETFFDLVDDRLR